MVVIKCKMCGGDLIIEPGSTVAECEYCGSRQTVPSVDNEKKLTLFARANRLRAACEFDKAAGIYESIVADFPEEAEAYWGLVLCKYGIEYVDDPATGKKIPTCHRSSFDSILEDSDFEQALENADAVARKVYREEAKQIDEIRKGIIEVSGKEEPYDIFICYKETDENGGRTLDSVLAQDVYDALTDKGYRVFFSRITLEDKLGQEYEPYIFAALNSAKIMLAFGTDYEYFNAVWVKNEWSRYLKLMASDKTKHLIPCYKGIDAYDMPKEFAKLQAQDMGKLGAMQDLLRGIEKILRSRNEAHGEARVFPTGDNTIALLHRGYMELEDSNWDKADAFFEDVLNQNAECSGAYLGKFLAESKCSSLENYVKKRLEQTEEARETTLTIPADRKRIAEAVQEYEVPGYLSKSAIQALYVSPNMNYLSRVASRNRQRAEEEKVWKSNKLLSRAVQFARGDTERQITEAHDALFSKMDERIVHAKNDERSFREYQERAYSSFLDQADKQADVLSNRARERRQSRYLELCGIQEQSPSRETLLSLVEGFSSLAGYEDCSQRQKQCQEMIVALDKKAEEVKVRHRAEQNAERERQIVIAEQKRKAQQKRNKMLSIIAAAAAAVVIVAAILVTQLLK